ncbi:MAG TPA: protein kinase, partial [Gemmataceae bacterium]|nr:protein kinase [Gemmataceae bacterium]
MSEHVSPEEEHLLQQLAIVDENPAATVEGTVRQLHAELETLASDVKSPPLADPHQKESACRRAVEQARSVMIEATRSVPAAESPTPLPEYLEHFRILKLLGQGGMGTVYLAEDTRLGRQVALKTLKPELAAWPQAHERFFREARLAATIEHDHVVPIYHVSEANGVPFLAMPCLKGHSLEEMIKTGRKWTPVQIVRLGVQIAEGLAVAHAKGLIHRDIKPGNLWVEPTGGGRVKILDFGLARLEASPGRESGELTQTGAILGTPAYMAPEQARGEKVDARADLYSFGVVLYRLATGRLPLRGTDTISMLMALASEQPQPVQELAPDLPPPLAELIMRLLAKDRNQRPASAREVSHTLRGILESLKTPTPAAQPVPVVVAPAQPVANPRADLDAAEPEKPVAPPRPQSTAKRRKPRRWALVAAGLASLAALILAGVILIIRDREGQEVARIEVKDGNTVEVKDKKVTITPPKAEPKPIDLAAEKDPERCVALWVLSIGGWVTIRDNGQEREILATAALPTTSFEVVCVDLNFKHVTDAGLVHLKDLKGLTALGLRETQVTDAGLVHLKELKGLTYLNLDGTQVTEAGLVHLKELKGLATLELAVPRVTDAGLVYLIKELKGLTGLSLRQTQVTDAGLVHLIKELKGLTNLDLAGTQVTDTGLVHLKELK